jgi:hypothetical protein
MIKLETEVTKFNTPEPTEEQIALFRKLWLDAWGIIKT